MATTNWFPKEVHGQHGNPYTPCIPTTMVEYVPCLRYLPAKKKTKKQIAVHPVLQTISCAAPVHTNIRGTNSSILPMPDLPCFLVP